MKHSLPKKVLFAVLLPIAAVIAAGVWLQHRLGPAKLHNIILISIDTCRADYLGCYGYPRDITPNIDDVAQEAVRFEQVISPVPMTLPAHCSMLTGTIPPYHGVHDNFQHLAPQHLSIAEVLKAHGFYTAAIISAFVLDSRFGLAQGFDSYKDDLPSSPDLFFYSERHAADTSHLACQWLQEHKKDQRFFLFLHYYDPHDPYCPPEPFATTFADSLYAGEIAYTDHCIGQVLEKLRQLGIYDSSLIIITGDHGEMLGEHGENTHGYFVYLSAIRVPLIIKLPGTNKGRRITQPTALIDIMPTVLSLAGIAVPASVQGQDMSGYILQARKPASARFIYTESLLPTEYKCNPLLAMVNWPWKYIHTTRDELYNLGDDPAEKVNLAPQQSRLARQLRGQMDAIISDSLQAERTDSKLELDEASLNRLMSLGYVGGRVDETFQVDETKPDPKDCIGLYERSNVLVGAIAAQKYEEARELCSQLLAERDDIPFLHNLAGTAAAATGRLQEAIDHYRDYLQLRPQDHEALNNLASVLSRQGNLEEAIRQWQEALRLKPDYFKAHYNLAGAFYKKGELQLAVKHWNEAVRTQPDAAEVLNNLAWVLATNDNERLRDPQRAARLARRACELTEFKHAGYLDTLAAAYAATGDFARATEIAHKALTLAQANNNTALAGRIADRIAKYEAAQPYRQEPATQNTISSSHER
jgi:arylsulfatase A-like enzyme/Tfp pilus assembly protein PilF